MPSTETTSYEVRQRAAWITLNRPDNRNALSAVLVNELSEHLDAALADPSVRCIVLTGTGPAFCAGADLKNPPGSGGSDKAGSGKPVGLPEILQKLMGCDKPVIAAVNGAAFGGGLGLVGAADLVVAAEDAPMSFSEVRLGVIPAIISVVCLPKLGTQHGMKLMLTGERFSGADAVRYGLVHQAVPHNQLHVAVQALVDQICLGGPTATAECKKLVRQVPLMAADSAFKTTAEWSRRLFQSPEAAEGMAAFREKRQPSWVQPG